MDSYPKAAATSILPAGRGVERGWKGGLTHEEEDDIGSHSWELDGARVDCLHQDVPVLVALVNISGLALDDILLQHSHHLHMHGRM